MNDDETKSSRDIWIAEFMESSLADIRDGLYRLTLLDQLPTQQQMRLWVAQLDIEIESAWQLHGGADYLERRRIDLEESPYFLAHRSVVTTDELLQKLKRGRKQ